MLSLSSIFTAQHPYSWLKNPVSKTPDSKNCIDHEVIGICEVSYRASTVYRVPVATEENVALLQSTEKA